MSLLGAAATRAEVSVRATIDRRPAVEGERLLLTVSVSGSAGAESDPALPGEIHEHFDASFAGSSRQMSFVNGQANLSIDFRYVLIPRNTGTFTIPPITVRVGKETFLTETLEVRVEPRPAPRRGSGTTQESSTRREADLFVEARVSKKRVVEGEEIILSILFFSPVRLLEREFTPPELTGFRAEVLPEVPARTEMVEGVAYTVEEARYSLIPLGKGAKTIGSAQIRAVVPTRRRDPFSVFGGFFDGRSMIVESEPVSITVDPLPPTEDPAFSGAIGQFELAATIDASEVDQNDPVTLTVTIEGRGNPGASGGIAATEASSFRVFDASAKTLPAPSGEGMGTRREIQRVFVPLVAGALEVPEVRFTYFDPRANDYRTLRAGPFPIVVRAAEGGSMVGMPIAGKGEVRKLREELRFIHTDAGDLEPIGRPGTRSWGWLIHLVPAATLAVVWVRRRQEDRLAGDRGLQRARRAAQAARSRLAAAQSRGEDGYAELWSAIGGYLADRMDLPVAVSTAREAERQLLDRGLPAVLATNVRAFGEQCDFARFAPGTPAEKAHDLLSRATALLDELEKALSTTGRGAGRS
jgi:hypothetical protein